MAQQVAGCMKWERGRQRAVGSVTGSNGSDCERHAPHCAVFISRFPLN